MLARDISPARCGHNIPLLGPGSHNGWCVSINVCSRPAHVPPLPRTHPGAVRLTPDRISSRTAVSCARLCRSSAWSSASSASLATTDARARRRRRKPTARPERRPAVRAMAGRSAGPSGRVKGGGGGGCGGKGVMSQNLPPSLVCKRGVKVLGGYRKEKRRMGRMGEGGSGITGAAAVSHQ